jgi:hypothetical protein
MGEGDGGRRIQEGGAMRDEWSQMGSYGELLIKVAGHGQAHEHMTQACPRLWCLEAGVAPSRVWR